MVPLDWRRPSGRKVAISFVRFRHTDRSHRQLGTIVVTEGGPGFSVLNNFPDAYTSLFGPLLERRDLVLVDQRGVGRSGAIDCEPLQQENSPIYAAVAKCGRQLGARADLYGTASVARDIEAVRAALGVHEFDFYGGSYAGMDIQAYAARFPHRLRSVVLDAPVVLSVEDPWFTNGVRPIVHDVAAICLRSGKCSATIHRPRAELRWLIRRLRSKPVDGTGRDADGRVHRLHVGEARLASFLASDAGGFVIQGEIAAAARALRHGDAAPLLRLAAEQDKPLFHGDSQNPAEFSVGDNVARFCTDGSFQWDNHASRATRRSQFRDARRALDPNRFAPFSVDAWVRPAPLGALPDPCIGWPKPTHRVTPPVPPGTVVPGVPALVITGELDLNVPASEPPQLSRMFPRSTVVELKNAGHHTVFSPRGDCASAIIAHFLRKRSAGNTDCAGRRGYTWSAVGEFPPLAGPSRSRAARIVAATVIDAFQRSFLQTGQDGVGLRGGTFHIDFFESRVTIHLAAARFATDLAVTGDANYLGFKTIDANLTVTGAHGGTLHVHGVWANRTATTLRVTGQLDGHQVSVTVPAN